MVQFALFKNGIELPNTRFSSEPVTYLAVQTGTAYIELCGNAMVSISQFEITGNTGDIELRCVGPATFIAGPDGGGAPTSSMRASLTFEKVVDI